VQRRWIRRPSPRVLVVALCSVTMVAIGVALSQADPGAGRAVSVATLSGGDAASLPGADLTLPGSASARAEAEPASFAPESPPPTEPSTTTTAARPHAAPAPTAARPHAAPAPTAAPPDTAPAPTAAPPDTAPAPAAAPPDTAPPSPPPPCPSAAPGEPGCTPPCSYEPSAGGPAAGSFAPCPDPSGVEGRVTAGPTCPVQRADDPCPDKPVETTLRLLRRDGSVAATGKSGADGTFRIAAAPGSYRLEADWPSRAGGCSAVDVTVEQGRFTHADVSCDTGIR